LTFWYWIKPITAATIRKIREVANEEDDFSVANMMEDHIAYFVKQLWFIQAMSK